MSSSAPSPTAPPVDTVPFAREADVLILGAGIMGCGLAWRLAAAGRRVLLIDRADPGGEASTAAAGILAAQIEARDSQPMLALGLASRALYPDWAAELRDETGHDIGFRRCGVLMLASLGDQTAVAAELADQEALWQQQRAAGLPVELLSPMQLARLEPALSKVAGALLFPEDGQVEPPRLLAALLAALHRRGCTPVRATVLGIGPQPTADGLHVVTLQVGEGTAARSVQVRAPQVALCSGSWSSLLPGSPLPIPTVGPVRGQMVELFSTPSPLRHVCYGHVPPRGAAGQQGGPLRHGYLVPRGDGRIVIGSTTERVGFVKELTVAGLLDLLSLAEGLVPTLGGATVTRTWSGLRPGSSDELPILGESTRRGLYVCTGHYRNGILLAPASVEAMAATMLGRSARVGASAATVPDLTPFHPSRFAR